MLEKFRKKIILENIVKGLLWGFSLGCLICAILLMSFMLGGLNNWTYYGIAIGVGAFAWIVTMVVFVIVKMPNDKVVAKRVDATYGLQEKTATMVEFKDQDGFLINKQRDDATINAKKQNPRKLTIKLAVWTLPALVLGASLVVASSFTSVIKESLTPAADIQEEKDKTNEDTSKIVDEIKDFIDDSKASQDFKEKLMAILEELEENLKDDLEYDSRYGKVEYSKQEVDDALDVVNTKEEIGRAIVASCYQDAKDRSKNYQTGLWEVGQGMIDGKSERISNGFNGVHENKSSDYNGMIEEVNNTKTYNGLSKLLKAWCSSDGVIYKAINTAKGKNYHVPENDSVLAVFVNLNAKIKKAYESLDVKYANSAATDADKQAVVDTTKDSVVKALKEALDDLIDQVAEENENTALAQQVKDYMDKLVDPESQEGDGDGKGEKGDGESEDGKKGDGDGDGNGDGDKSDSDGNGNGESDDESDSDNKGNGAGGGDGNTNTASDDKVYAGEDGSTTYDKVISDYQGDAANDSKGTEDEGAVGDYFDMLYNGKNNGGN